MKNFIVYSKNTGEILRTGTCPSNMISIQASKLNEKVIEGVANDLTEKIYKGTVIKKSGAEIYAYEEATKPNPVEVLIQLKMKELLREQAITELKREGKIE